MTALPDAASISGVPVSSGFSGISGSSVSSGTAVVSGNADISVGAAIRNIPAKLIFFTNVSIPGSGAAVGSAGFSVSSGISTDGVSLFPESVSAWYSALINGKSKSDTALPSVSVVTVPSLVPASTIFSPSTLKMSCLV